MVFWDEIAAEVAKEFKMLVDAMTTRMVVKPAGLDTIVATNLHADILSDLAALAGGLGIASTANLDPKRRFPSCSSERKTATNPSRKYR
jgi:tartrate dehydrogenase/decarboxylase/D-malate dehydrogenase